MSMQSKNKSRERWRNIALVALPGILIVFGWLNVVNTARDLEENTIKTYQDAQEEIVKNAARAAEFYIEDQIDLIESEGGEVTSDDLNAIEQEVLRRFVDPIQIADIAAADAWIYSPDYVVFDQSEDFPDIYRGKSMSEIFEIQKDFGAEHYQDMATAVGKGEGGKGWYIWDPNKGEESASEWEFLTQDNGREIAAWTPVQVFPGTEKELTWLIGMTSPLPDLMKSNGAYDQIRSNIIQMLIISLLVVGLLAFLLRAEAQVQELRQQVQELRVEIDQAKRADQVSEIVESEYFQDLAARAKALRERSDT